MKLKSFVCLNVRKNKVSTVQNGAFKNCGLSIVPFLPIPMASFSDKDLFTLSIYPLVP